MLKISLSFLLAAVFCILNGAELSDVEGEAMECAYELIIAVAASGYTDLVMDAAREAGAGGGTVVHAKGTAAAHAEKFFGCPGAETAQNTDHIASRQSYSFLSWV